MVAGRVSYEFRGRCWIACDWKDKAGKGYYEVPLHGISTGAFALETKQSYGRSAVSMRRRPPCG